MNDVDEMSGLNRDMKAFFDANGAEYPVLLASGAHSQFGLGEISRLGPEQRANPFEMYSAKTTVFAPPAITETDL